MSAFFHLDLAPLFQGENVRLRLGPIAIAVAGVPVALSSATAITFRVKARAGDAEPAVLEKTLASGVSVDGDFLNIDLVPANTAGLGRRPPHYYEWNVTAAFAGGVVKFIAFPSRLPIRSVV